MGLKEQLQADLKDAMKGGEDVRKTLIRGVMAALKEAEQRKHEDLAQKALKKHGVTRPTAVPSLPHQDKADADARMGEYQRAVDAAFAAEDIDAGSALTEAEALTIIQKL